MFHQFAMGSYGGKTLADFPEVLAQWDSANNASFLNLYSESSMIPVGSNKRARWSCSVSEDHKWDTQISDRFNTNNERGYTECPFCCNKRLSITNSLQTVSPDIAKELHSDMNGDLISENLVAFSSRFVWWKCDVADDHVWRGKVSDRVRNNSNCPFCINQRASITNSLASLHPEIAKQLHPDLNGNLTAETIVAGSNRRVWWKCDIADDHVWRTAVYSRTTGANCPFCCNQKASVTNSLESLFPEIAQELHPTLNGKISGADLPAGSGRKVWWKCDVADDHEWKTAPVKRTGEGKTDCPCCSIPAKQLSVTNRLDLRYPELVNDWHSKNPKGPESYFHSSNQTVWWWCGICGHEWRAVIANRSRLGSGCPSCEGMVVHSDGGNSLLDVNPAIAEEWHPTKNGNKKPSQIRPASGIPVWWICLECGHDWKTSPNHRVTGDGRAKSGCASCSPSGFDPLKSAALYCMSIEGSEGVWWYKLGIAHDVEKRRRNISRSLKKMNMELDVIVLEMIEFEHGQNAKDLETALLSIEEIRIKVLEKFDGSTELFSVNPLSYAREHGIIKADPV